MLEVIAVLLVLTFNLLITFGLAAIMYYLVVLPLNKEVKLLRSKNSNFSLRPQQAIWTKQPDNLLPDMDDIPEEAFYGEDIPDYTTTPEQVEDALADRSYSTYNAGQVSSSKQLRSLNL